MKTNSRVLLVMGLWLAGCAPGPNTPGPAGTPPGSNIEPPTTPPNQTPAGPVVFASAPGKVNKTNTATIVGSATAGLGIQSVKVNGQDVTTANGYANWQTTVTLLPAPNTTLPSENVFTVTAADSAGVEATPATVTILRYEDSTAPVIGSTLPVAPLASESVTVQLRVRVTDNAGVGSVTVDGAPAAKDAESGDWIGAATTPAGSTLAHSVIATDIFGNASAPYSATLTTLSPVFTQGTALGQGEGRTFMYDSDFDRLLELHSSGVFATVVSNQTEPGQPNVGVIYDVTYASHIGSISGPERIGAVASSGGMVWLIDPVTRVRESVGTRPENFIPLGIAFHPTGGFVSTAYVVGQALSPAEGRIYSVNLSSGAVQLLASFAFPLKPWRVKVDATRSRLIVTGYNDLHIVTMNTTNNMVADLVARNSATAPALGLLLDGDTLFFTRNDAKLFAVNLTNDTVAEQTLLTGGSLMGSAADIVAFGPANQKAVFSYLTWGLLRVAPGPSAGQWNVTYDYADGRTGSGPRFTTLVSGVSSFVFNQPAYVVQDLLNGLMVVGSNTGARTALAPNPAVTFNVMTVGSNVDDIYGVDNGGTLRKMVLSTQITTAVPNGTGFSNARAIAYSEGTIVSGAPSLLVVRSTNPPTLKAVRLSDGNETLLATLEGNGNFASLVTSPSGVVHVGIERKLWRVTTASTATELSSAGYNYEALGWDRRRNAPFWVTSGAEIKVLLAGGTSQTVANAMFANANFVLLSDLPDEGYFVLADNHTNGVQLVDQFTNDTFFLSR